MGEVSIWSGGKLISSRAPASGELLVGNGSDFDLTQSSITFGNPIVINVPVTVNGQVWSTTGGFKFPDNSVQVTAATSYSPPTYANNTIVANYSGSTAAPTGYTLTSILDSVFGTTQGTVLYRGASTWSALAPGTSGQYLQTQGAGANPQWATVTKPQWTSVFRTANVSYTSTTTPVADAQLRFAMAANTNYRIRCRIDFSTNTSGGGGIKITTSGPTATTYYTAGGITWATDTGGTGISGPAVSSDTSISNTTYGLVVTTLPVRTNATVMFDIFIVTSSSPGTFVLNMSQNTSNTTATVVRAGSYLEYATF